MRIVDIFYLDGKAIAGCLGEDITPETKCGVFEQNGKIYTAETSAVSNSISDNLQLFIMLPGNTDVQRGPIRIVG